MFSRIIWLSAIALGGCASAIHDKNSDNYTLIGYQAQQRGDWDAARRAYAKAVVNAEMGSIPIKSRSIRTYEYGRALGVTCFFDLAEAELKTAYKLDKQSSQPLFLSLVELARLNFSQEKFAASLPYYEEGIAELDKASAAEKAPGGYAEILEEYAIALAKTGNVGDSKKIMVKVSEIKTKNPKASSITDKTPYGKFCTTK
jgi:tetratricopeptide (TPR) repeat protein